MIQFHCNIEWRSTMPKLLKIMLILNISLLIIGCTHQENIEKQDVCDAMTEFREAIIKAEGGRLYGSDIFYVESCVYLMTLYDLLTSGHRVWQVYDCFYSTGEEDQKTFEYMISSGVKLNFESFIRHYWK